MRDKQPYPLRGRLRHPARGYGRKRLGRHHRFITDPSAAPSTCVSSFARATARGERAGREGGREDREDRERGREGDRKKERGKTERGKWERGTFIDRVRREKQDGVHGGEAITQQADHVADPEPNRAKSVNQKSLKHSSMKAAHPCATLQCSMRACLGVSQAQQRQGVCFEIAAMQAHRPRQQLRKRKLAPGPRYTRCKEGAGLGQLILSRLALRLLCLSPAWPSDEKRE